jgi:hypothetical protein
MDKGYPVTRGQFPLAGHPTFSLRLPPLARRVLFAY